MRRAAPPNAALNVCVAAGAAYAATWLYPTRLPCRSCRLAPRSVLQCPTHLRTPPPARPTCARRPATCARAAAASACTCDDGKIRYIEGNPEHPLNQGVICAKGSSGIMKQYSPARLTRPLLRKAGAERGAGEFEADQLGAGLRDPDGAAGEDPRDRPEEVRALHRPRPDAGADGAVRAAVRHAELRRARRLLLGQHGRRDDLHDRRVVLGVRRARPRPREALLHDRHRRGSSLQSAEDRDFQVQAARRPLRVDQSGAHRLFGDRRRMGADQAGHRRRAAAGADPRDHRKRTVRPRLPGALHERRPARERRRRQRRIRHVRAHRSARRGSLLRPAEQAVVGPDDQRAGA